MVYSHCMGLGIGPGSMRSNILCRKVNTGLRQGQGPGPIVSYCASPVPFAGSCPLQCE